MVNIGNSWDSLLKEEFNKEYYLNLRKELAKEYKEYIIYPNMYDIFNALKNTSYEDTKVVILGQDPYHGPNQAHGLCFSVQKNVEIPPSLKNIYKELNDDIGFTVPEHGNLTQWTQNGVLLLNTVLTVRSGQPNSHKNIGWITFTDNIIKILNSRESPIVFLLWGNNAKSKMNLLTNPNHLVLCAAHPSPLSAYNGFFGCKHFSKANEFLISKGIDPVNWNID